MREMTNGTRVYLFLHSLFSTDHKQANEIRITKKQIYVTQIQIKLTKKENSNTELEI